MKKLLSIVLTGAVALSAGAYYIAPTQQTSLTANADEKYEMLSYHVSNTFVTITDCLDIAKGEIVIPEKIEKLPVTSIGQYAFRNNEYITSIVLPETIKSVVSSAFEGCGLETIEMQEGVGSIPSYAFRNAKNLKHIEIPESVESIGVEAFKGCTSLESITIKNPYCDIHDNATTISDTAVIYGYENSTAQFYAEVYGREFRLIGEDLPEIPEETTTTTESTTTTTETETTTTETIKGDANGDNSVTIADAVAILQYLANPDEYPLDEQGAKNADVFGDDGINTEDALQIQKLDAGVIDKL